MFSFVMAFFLGDLYLHYLYAYDHLPSLLRLFCFSTVTFLFYLVFYKQWKYSYLPFAFMIGLSWSVIYATFLLSWQLSKNWESKPLVATGYIASIPIKNHFQTHFLFKLIKLEQGSSKQYPNIFIKLAFYKQNLKLKVGGQYQFLIKLKKIHATQNPGSFNYEAWSLHQGLRAQGTLISSNFTKYLGSTWRYPINQLRQYLHDLIKAHLPLSQEAPWLMTLLIGEHEEINENDWKVLRNTGTNHLMAIAGLHIGLIATWVYGLTSFIWRRFSFCVLLMPASQIAAIMSAIAALFYSALAGFSLPTERACIMLLTFIFAVIRKIKINPWHSWACALCAIIIFNPLNILAESFWLSFFTIALIVYGMKGRLAPKGLWWQWGRMQWLIGLGLIPITLLFFQECSFISFLANSIAVPWLGLFILPFCFLGCIFLLVYPPAANFFLVCADKSLSGLWWCLNFLSEQHFATWYGSLPTVSIGISLLLGFLLLLAPTGFPGRWFGIIGCLPFIFYSPLKPKVGEFWLTLLDVGQGLAIVIETKQHTLIYDTGLKYGNHFNMGDSVILPFLYTRRLRSIDLLMISHGDNDHIGGADALLKKLSFYSIKTSVPQKFSVQKADYCLAGDSWSWDQVKFKILYPTSNFLNLGNNSSCVLQIDNGKKRVLLTGDIEKEAEKILLNKNKNDLAANILVAPHHGSKTSSIVDFISAVHPQFVLYATGYLNRYHFPHASVERAYHTIHAQTFNTAYEGAIQFQLDKNGTIIVDRYRKMHKNYWDN